MESSKTITKTVFAWRYLLFTISCVGILGFLEYQGGLRLSVLLSKNNDIPYLTVVLYTIVPLFLIWSLLKFITAPLYLKRLANQGDFLTVSNEKIVPIERFLYQLERELVIEAENYKKLMKRSEFYGKLFSLSSLVIPGLSWCYTFILAAYTKDPPSLGLFGFSSMMAGGTVGVTVGVTMLRHSKSLQPYVEKVSNEITHIRKLRIVCLANPEPTENSEIMVKVLETLLVKPGDDSRNRDDEMNSDTLSIMGSALQQEKDKDR